MVLAMGLLTQISNNDYQAPIKHQSLLQDTGNSVEVADWCVQSILDELLHTTRLGRFSPPSTGNHPRLIPKRNMYFQARRFAGSNLNLENPIVSAFGRYLGDATQVSEAVCDGFATMPQAPRPDCMIAASTSFCTWPNGLTR